VSGDTHSEAVQKFSTVSAIQEMVDGRDVKIQILGVRNDYPTQIHIKGFNSAASHFHAKGFSPLGWSSAHY
jgi:hypothetical protein